MLRLEGVRVEREGWFLRADLAVPKGAAVAVMGPSGAGKSTLLSVIGGFEEHAGHVLWEEAPIDGLPPGRRPVATLFQDGNLFPHLSARRNVALGVRPDGRLGARDRARVDAALEDAGLGRFGDRLPGDLSGGQMARVALARIAVQDRPILLLDEAFSGLGPALKAEMLDRTVRLAAEGGRTLLMVTHEPEDARRICPETILVAEGIAHRPVGTEALLSDPPEALRAYLGT
ncbi:thiamine transport system ATP-binding protein [Hasllibacter halocynthiae]|uniref:Thiamine transport system ATP-binding protein n=1 Tax=Hasllibacter halocynthiae TaxID=595589 RepID=A0A2T0X374_9RHOB|nr:ATP-binding cassette domain-containing protein [Hasllibacter halocynthiae]PRY93390.1 thiamine transport system ATP-binding protein [Hasllibacter halocynthiae]